MVPSDSVVPDENVEEDEGEEEWPEYWNYHPLKEMAVQNLQDHLEELWVLGAKRSKTQTMRMSQVIMELNDEDFGRGFSHALIGQRTGIGVSSLSTYHRKYRQMVIQLREEGKEPPPGHPGSASEPEREEGEGDWDIDKKVVGPSASHLQHQVIRELGHRAEGDFKFRLEYAGLMENRYPALRANSNTPEDFCTFFDEGMLYYTDRGPILEETLLELGEYVETMRRGMDEHEAIIVESEQRYERLSLRTRRLMRSLRRETDKREAVAELLQDMGIDMEELLGLKEKQEEKSEEPSTVEAASTPPPPSQDDTAAAEAA